MRFSYNFEAGDMMTDEMAVSLFAGIFLVVLAFALIFGLVFYIFQSIGIYRIAKRRGIHHAWLAWVPIVNSWTIGCISDQYQYLVRGKNTKRRVILLTLAIVTAVLNIIGSGSTITTMFSSIAAYSNEAFAPALTGSLVLGSTASYLAAIVGIVNLVFTCIALYDLYNSCWPSNAVMFLVLGIVFSITQPFFLFACRNRDDGMPPRKLYP